MPSRKSEAVSSSQWTDKLEAGDAACAVTNSCNPKTTGRVRNIRIEKGVRLMRVMAVESPSRANSSTRMPLLKRINGGQRIFLEANLRFSSESHSTAYFSPLRRFLPGSVQAHRVR